MTGEALLRQRLQVSACVPIAPIMLCLMAQNLEACRQGGAVASCPWGEGSQLRLHGNGSCQGLLEHVQLRVCVCGG